MNRNATVSLDSVRLIERFADQLPCYVCDQFNMPEAEFCRQCLAPMALAHQVRSQGRAPQMVAALGACGAGKTVYLGLLLDMLSRLPDRMQILARGAFSVTLQQNTTMALARCEFPSKTSASPDRWNWVHCELELPRQSRSLEMIVPDMAGEALFAEIVRTGSYPVVRSFLQKAQGALLLIDACKLAQGGLDEEFNGMKVLSYLSELGTRAKRSWQGRPLAILFTKADQCDRCLDDPAAFAARHAPGLWRLCQQRFKQHQFFAASVAGACACRKVGERGLECIPLRIEPRGVIEPFEWIVKRMKK